MMLTLTLAAGLLAAPEPQAEPQKEWVIEVRGFTKHLQGQPKDQLIIDFQWPQAKPQIEPVEDQYHDDLSAFFKQFKVQTQVQAVEAFYVDDLPAYLKSLKQQKR
jgi:hypothetical protein